MIERRVPLTAAVAEFLDLEEVSSLSKAASFFRHPPLLACS